MLWGFFKTKINDATISKNNTTVKIYLDAIKPQLNFFSVEEEIVRNLTKDLCSLTYRKNKNIIFF